MRNLQVFFVLAITLNLGLGMNLRPKRQSEDSEDNNLDDRYGWDRPQGPENQQWQPWLPNQPEQPRQTNQANNPNWQNGQNGQNGQQNPGQPQPVPQPNGNGVTAQAPTVQACIRACPVTSEYNPVCGTNMVQYENPGRLLCAQGCGVSVSLMRSSPCPATTTAAPPS